MTTFVFTISSVALGFAVASLYPNRGEILDARKGRDRRREKRTGGRRAQDR
jgi:hypothetical protein